MMLFGTQKPFTEPVAQRLEQGGTSSRMTSEDFPLFVCWSRRLVEDLRWNFEFADVVQQRTPTQTIQVIIREAHLLPDDIGIGANTFGMTSGERFMFRELDDEVEGLLGSHLGI